MESVRPVASLLDDNRLPTQLARVEVGGLAVLGLAKLAVHLLTNATLDFHRDELYYLGHRYDCGACAAL